MSKKFYSQVEMRLDSKGRVALPPQYRKFFENDVVVWRMGNHLKVFTPKGFDEVAGVVNQHTKLENRGIQDYFSPDAQRDRRLFYANRFDMQLDGNHRITVPKTLRSQLAMVEDVVWLGCGDYLELWAEHHYLADCARLGEASGNNTLFAGSPPSIPSAQDSTTPGIEGDGQE